jgi:hypothetical protein
MPVCTQMVPSVHIAPGLAPSRLGSYPLTGRAERYTHLSGCNELRNCSFAPGSRRSALAGRRRDRDVACSSCAWRSGAALRSVHSASRPARPAPRSARATHRGAQVLLAGTRTVGGRLSMTPAPSPSAAASPRQTDRRPRRHERRRGPRTGSRLPPLSGRRSARPAEAAWPSSSAGGTTGSTSHRVPG